MQQFKQRDGEEDERTKDSAVLLHVIHRLDRPVNISEAWCA